MRIGLMTVCHVAFNRKAVLQAASQRQFICIFQLSAKGNAAGDGGDADRMRLYFFLNIKNSSVALDGWTKRKNNFLHLVFLKAVKERFNFQLIGAYTIERGNNTS